MIITITIITAYILYYLIKRIVKRKKIPKEFGKNRSIITLRDDLNK